LKEKNQEFSHAVVSLGPTYAQNFEKLKRVAEESKTVCCTVFGVNGAIGVPFTGGTWECMLLV